MAGFNCETAQCCEVLRNPDQIAGAAGADNVSTLSTAAAMKVKVIDRKPVKVSYLRHVGPYGKPLSDFGNERCIVDAG